MTKQPKTRQEAQEIAKEAPVVQSAENAPAASESPQGAPGAPLDEAPRLNAEKPLIVGAVEIFAENANPAGTLSPEMKFRLERQQHFDRITELERWIAGAAADRDTLIEEKAELREELERLRRQVRGLAGDNVRLRARLAEKQAQVAALLPGDGGHPEPAVPEVIDRGFLLRLADMLAGWAPATDRHTSGRLEGAAETLRALAEEPDGEGGVISYACGRELLTHIDALTAVLRDLVHAAQHKRMWVAGTRAWRPSERQ